MKRGLLLFGLVLTGCALGTSNTNNKFGSNGSGDGGLGLGNGNNGTNPQSGTPVIYAHTDKELYEFDPTTHGITDLGAFKEGSSSYSSLTITDLAVNSAGDVWVNSETAIYKADVSGNSGEVPLTLVANIAAGSGQKFYALGFAPAGVLGSGETLVAGDNNGILFAVDGSGNLQQLGSFGNGYQLSGDVMFYMLGGTAKGLATLRSSSSSTNDVLAEIDVAAMQQAYQSKTPATNLTKQLLGSGTGFGRLFGIGAWDSTVYAFSRESSGTPAQLVAIDSSGNGTVIQSFGQITSGWSGAGVTTTAKVTVLPN